jgi:hypothetical protein
MKYVVLLRSLKWDKEYVMDEKEYYIFKNLPYKRAMNYLKELDKQPTDTSNTDSRSDAD